MTNSNDAKIKSVIEFLDEAFIVTEQYFDQELDLDSPEGKVLQAVLIILDEIEEILRS